MPIKLITAPAAEPLSLTETKLHLRVTTTDDDTWITDAIQAAREDAEQLTRRALITQQWRATLDYFPKYGLTPFSIIDASGYGLTSFYNPAGRLRTGFEIILPFPRLQTVDSITYIDTDGTTQTLASTEYIVDITSEPGRLTPAYGKAWPATQMRINAVTINFTCGYGPLASDVPMGIKRWMKLRVGTLYEQREEVALLNRGTIQYLPYVETLLDSYRVY